MQQTVKSCKHAGCRPRSRKNKIAPDALAAWQETALQVWAPNLLLPIRAQIRKRVEAESTQKAGFTRETVKDVVCPPKVKDVLAGSILVAAARTASFASCRGAAFAKASLKARTFQMVCTTTLTKHECCPVLFSRPGAAGSGTESRSSASLDEGAGEADCHTCTRNKRGFGRSVGECVCVWGGAMSVGGRCGVEREGTEG
eukprot:434656-Pleurochrysis_carterae.AAC.1